MPQETSSFLTSIESTLRIGFFGTPYLASRVLEDLLSDTDFEVAFVVTNPDKPVGRSGDLQPTPVKKLALERDIPTYTPTKIRENIDFFEQLKNHNCDYFVVVAYGRILPVEILQIPKKLCINVHGSLLPKYRGASPIQAALLHGEKETGVTIMVMSEGMDEGDMLSIEKIVIEDRETSETLFGKFAQISGKALIDAITNYEGGITNIVPQNHVDATYCAKIEKEDGLIDWTKSSEEIYHMWQAYTPWPGIYTMYEGKRLLLEKVSVILGSSQNPDIQKEPFLGAGFLHTQEGQSTGTVLRLQDGSIGIVCGEGVLTLEQVKLEGKKSQIISDFVNGQKGFIGYKFWHESNMREYISE